MREHLYEAESKIQAGLGRYTWQSLNIKEYCDRCEIVRNRLVAQESWAKVHIISSINIYTLLQLMKSLNSMVAQIAFIGSDIRANIAQIMKFSHFVIDAEDEQKLQIKARNEEIVAGKRRPSCRRSAIRRSDDNQLVVKNVQFIVADSVRPCQEYFTKLELVRNEKISRMRKLFESVGPILVKLESLILGTFTGESPKMKQYYVFWEKELFTLIVKLTAKNLEDFCKLLTSEEPLFQIDAVLNSPDIVMRPNACEIYNIVVHSVKDFLERFKSFTRWMNGTCRMCPPIGSDNEQYIYSFFEDVVQIPQIGEIVMGLQGLTQKLVGEVQAYLARWRKYQALWKYDKVLICEKFVNLNLPLVRLDEKFLFYTQTVEDLRKAKTYYDVKGIRINLQPLIDSICEHATDWRNTLGRILAERTQQNLIALKEHVERLRLNMDRNIRGLQDFKTVMETITIIQSTTLSIELRAREMMETYSVLEEHSIKFSYTDMLMAYHLEKRWKKLYNSSLIRGESLAPIKNKFAEMTCSEISTFSLDVGSLVSSLFFINIFFSSFMNLCRRLKKKGLARLVKIWIAELN